MLVRPKGKGWDIRTGMTRITVITIILCNFIYISLNIIYLQEITLLCTWTKSYKPPSEVREKACFDVM
jgi:hypothetical protein